MCLISARVLFVLLLLLQGCSSRQSILQGEPDEVDVIIFSSTDCPIANALAPAIERLHHQVQKEGGQLYLVHAWAGKSNTNIEEHAREYGLTMEIIVDGNHALVKQFGATVTPEAVVLRYDVRGKPQVVYQGLINNLFDSPGNRRDRATRHYVSDAIKAAVSGKTVDTAYRLPTGCSIEQMQ